MDWLKSRKKFFTFLAITAMFIALWANFYGIMLAVHGLHETVRIDEFSQSYSLWIGRHGGERFRVIFSERNGGEFAMLRRTALGLWRVHFRNDFRDDGGSLGYSWSTGAGVPGLSLGSFAYHNATLYIGGEVRSYEWFQICETQPPDRPVLVRVIPIDDGFIFHFSAENIDALDEIRRTYGLIEAAKNRICELME